MADWTSVRLPLGDGAPEAKLLYGQDVRVSLRGMEPASVHCVVTSPPYWGLRSYLGADDVNKAMEIGSESTLDGFVANLVELFRDLKRVLRKDGTVWLNLGDSYAGGGRAGKNPEYQKRHTSFGKHDSVTTQGGMGLPSAVPDGLKPKDMIGVPWRVAFALQKDGWYLRAACPWIKRNVLPESCTDRPSSAVEYIFLLAHPDSGGKYCYDIHGSRSPLAGSSIGRLTQSTFDMQTGGEKDYGTSGVNTNRSARKGVENLKAKLDAGDATRQRRATDWFFASLEDILNGEQVLLHDEGDDPLAFIVNPKPYSGAHFACFPPKLVEPCVLLSTSAHGVCSKCGAPQVHIVERSTARDMASVRDMAKTPLNVVRAGWRTAPPPEVHRDEWVPACVCGAGFVPATVLDVFSGSGTTGMVALQHCRSYVGLDLNVEYLPLAEARIRGDAAPQSAKPEDDSEDTVFNLFGGEE